MAHHPDFVRFAAAFKQARYREALPLVDALLREFPDEPWLHWHRACTLEKLERYAELPAVLDRVLALKPDLVAALVKRAQYRGADEAEALEEALEEDLDECDGDPAAEAERARREREFEQRAEQRARENEADLRRALEFDPDHVEALFLMSELLQSRDTDAARGDSERLLDRAISLAPSRLDLREARAARRRREALLGDEGAIDESQVVTTYSGLRFSRPALEAALADHEHCHALSGDYRHALRMGSLLHDLGRYDEALARYDQALAALPADAPSRAAILEQRARSENGGAGEREQMARLLEQAVAGSGRDRTLAEDMATQTILGAVRAVRAGRPVQAALEASLSEDPDTMLANSIAQQILNLAHEPEPGLQPAEARDYPAYQRRHADAMARRLRPLGIDPICDAEAHGLFPVLGQHVLIRCFSDESGETGVAAFALRPKWPGWIGFLLMLLTGKWKTHTMLECLTQFDDGTLLTTQPESVSPFEYGGLVRVEKLPAGTSPQQLVEHHLARVAAHKISHPGSTALTAFDLEGVERRWIEGQRVKRAYRESIGYITEGELQRMLGAQHARYSSKVRERLRTLAADYS